MWTAIIAIKVKASRFEPDIAGWAVIGVIGMRIGIIMAFWTLA